MQFITLHDWDDLPVRINIARIMVYQNPSPRDDNYDRFFTKLYMQGEPSPMLFRETPEDIDAMMIEEYSK
jgi:hypothetical protein